MNAEQLQVIQERWEKVLQQAWSFKTTDEGFMLVELDEAHMVGWDMENSCYKCFEYLDQIAHAPHDIKLLLEEVIRVRGILRQLLVDTPDTDCRWECPYCGKTDNYYTHACAGMHA